MKKRKAGAYREGFFNKETIVDKARVSRYMTPNRESSINQEFTEIFFSKLKSDIQDSILSMKPNGWNDERALQQIQKSAINLINIKLDEGLDFIEYMTIRDKSILLIIHKHKKSGKPLKYLCEEYGYQYSELRNEITARHLTKGGDMIISPKDYEKAKRIQE